LGHPKRVREAMLVQVRYFHIIVDLYTISLILYINGDLHVFKPPVSKVKI
jgi:hypothetical protein